MKRKNFLEKPFKIYHTARPDANQEEQKEKVKEISRFIKYCEDEIMLKNCKTESEF